MDLQPILDETLVASAEHHEVLGSTNNRGRECVAEHLPLPRLIVADRQTAGRGRGSNQWWTGQGSLAMSLVLPAGAIAGGLGHSTLISLAVGVAVVETVEQAIATFRPDHDPAGNLGLHWPNDVMLDGRKLVGILIEALPERVHVVGIGINTNNTAADAPDELREKVATLRDATGAPCDHVELLISLLKRLETWLGKLNDAPEEVAGRADELCLQRDRVLTIAMGKEKIAGRCRGIGNDGALLLDVGDGLRACYTGVVQ